MTPAITGSKASITVAVMCAALMAVLDISIVNVALSDIRASFGTPIDQIGWVSVSYLMANVVIIPMTGWLQRRFGFRRYFGTSILLFTGASVLCGLAWDLPSLILFRVLQGLGGGAIIPTSQSILFARYPKEEHAQAGALFGLGAVTGPLLGPTVGGYLIEVASWHWIFLINVPIGLLAALLSFRSIEQPGFRPARDRVDAVGIALLAVGMVSLQYVLEDGNREGWWDSSTVVGLFLLSVVTLSTFVVHELETDAPVVDFRVFKSRSYAAGTGINCLLGVALFSGTYAFSLYCGAVMRYSALDTGLIFLCAGASQVALVLLLGRIGNRVDGRYLVAAGIALMCLGLWRNARLTHLAGFLDLAEPQVLRALGMGLIFVPLSVITLSDLPADQRGNAAGLFSLTRELGGSVGTAWIGTSIDLSAKGYGASLGQRIDLYNPVAREQMALLRRGVGASLHDPTEGTLAILQSRVLRQALVRAFNDAFLLVAAAFIGALLLVLLLKRHRAGAPIQGAH